MTTFELSKINKIMSNRSIPKFPVVRPSLHTEMRNRVNAYFMENKINQTGNKQLYFKAFLLVSLFLITYLHLMLFKPVWYLAIFESAVLGLLIAFIGFNVMHDGSHGSFSQKKWENRIASYSMSILGASHFMWNIKHNMIHHSFTNVDGVDDDIEIGILMRFAPTQRHLKYHRFQHIYFGVFYAMMYLFWVFYSDYNKYFTKKIGVMPLKKMSTKEHIAFWAIKVFHLLAYCIIPILVWGFWSWLIGYLVMSFVGGFVLSIVFQLAHTVEHTEFPVADIETNRLEDEFAIHQIKTTANFATNNKTVSWLLGGLNFQIEHHLFPKISHVHYPALSKIIQEVCEEYELNYIAYPTVVKAIRAHVNFLKEMGRGDQLEMA